MAMIWREHTVADNTEDEKMTIDSLYYVIAAIPSAKFSRPIEWLTSIRSWTQDYKFACRFQNLQEARHEAFRHRRYAIGKVTVFQVKAHFDLTEA